MFNNPQLVGWGQINLPIFFRATKPFNHGSFLPDILVILSPFSSPSRMGLDVAATVLRFW